MDIALVQERTPELMSQLFALWRRSVEETHDFLGPADIDRIATYVPDARLIPPCISYGPP